MTTINAVPAARSAVRENSPERLLELLSARRYEFVTTTPATHARLVARRPSQEAADLRDVFGWSLPFRPAALEPEILATLVRADGLEACPDGRFRSRYRVSSLRGLLFLHSAYPTEAADAVFFGPDSYRFAAFVERELARSSVRRGAHLVDLGAGAGVGAIVAGRVRPDLRLTMTDVNPEAIRLARINALAAGIAANFAVGASLAGISDPIDLVIANPPYIIDGAGRDYRDGGDMHGARVAYDMAQQAVARLVAGGRLLLYTGSAIVAGHDELHAALADLAGRAGCTLDYDELDPDVFGEELENPAYRDVERIALVGAVMTREP